MNSNDRNPEQRHSSLSKLEEHPVPLPSNGQKRPRAAESVESSKKRVRPSVPQDTASGLSESRSSHISHWAQEQVWPPEFFEEDAMHRALARKKSGFLRRKRSQPSLTTQSTTVLSDERLREGNSAPYKHARYELQLGELDIYLSKYEDDITDESKNLCRKLLETPQTLPQGTLFADDLFEKTLEMIRNRNETRVIRDIAQLVVPSAEVLALRGAKHFKTLTETVNEGWNNSVPLLGPRPQPDYGTGYKRESFNRDQLRKLKPFIGDFDDQSLFVATYKMYFPFFTSEVKCGAAALDVADRQNAHSMAIALTGLVELFRLVGREKELHREINCFSISHDDENVRIHGYYAVIAGAETKIYRHLISTFAFRYQDGKEKWTANIFVQNVYEWSQSQFERICSVIDELPSEQDLELPHRSEPQVSENQGLSFDRHLLS